jgi:hypothetical protein
MAESTKSSKIPFVPVSVGELLDKLTILDIKSQKIADPAKLANISRERNELRAIADGLALDDKAIGSLTAELEQVNLSLWDIEDQIREHEARGDFGPSFIALARAVYKTNDRRAHLKRQINDASNSQLVEEKSYAEWQA